MTASLSLLGWKAMRGKDIARACSSAQLPLDRQLAKDTPLTGYLRNVKYINNYQRVIVTTSGLRCVLPDWRAFLMCMLCAHTCYKTNMGTRYR